MDHRFPSALRPLELPEDLLLPDPSNDGVSPCLTGISANRELFSDGNFMVRPIPGSSLDWTTSGWYWNRPTYEGFSRKRTFADFNDMALTECLNISNAQQSKIAPSLPLRTPSPVDLQSHTSTRSSAQDSGYWGSEIISRPSERREERPWICQFCGKSYIRKGDLRQHARTKHEITSGTVKHLQQDANFSLVEAQDNKTTKSQQSNLGEISLRETSPVQINKDDSGRTPITVSLLYKLESCLLELSSQSAEGFRIPLLLKIDGVTTNINIDMYNTLRPKSQTLPTNSGTRQLQPVLGDVTKSDPCTLLRHSPFEKVAHSSIEDEIKLMDYQKYDTTDKLDKEKVNKKRENPEHDVSHYSGALIDSNEEGDDDSDYERDNISTWDCSQRDTLPSFLPYIRSYDADTSSPCGDSPDGGSTTSGTTGDTPASFVSSLTGGNGSQGNGHTPLSAGSGPSNNGNDPILGTGDEIGAKVAAGPQPLPFICWYSAAGIACTAKNVKRSTEIRHLLNDHAWGKLRQGPNHRLSDACQRCKRLFLTQELLEAHVHDIAHCRKLSSVELEEFNRDPNRLGISLECKEAVDDLRRNIDKEMKANKLPALRDDGTMALLKQRVDSNVLLYINGSNTSEKKARSQLWKWYLIFKKLRPDDEVPRNPFISAQQPAGPEEKARADALRMFMHITDQIRMEGRLPEFDDEQRTALGRGFLDTLEMLGANEANERSRSVQSTSRNPRKRQRLLPPENYVSAPDSVDLTLASTTTALAPMTTAIAPAPAPAPASIQVPVPPSVPNSINVQHPFTLPQEHHQLLTLDNYWQQQQQQQQQQEVEDGHLLFSTGDFRNTNPSIEYEEPLEF